MIKEKNLAKIYEELIPVMAEKLTPRERDIIRLHLGLDDGILRGFEEIGQLFGVTKTEVEDILNSAKEKINDLYINIMQIIGYKLLLFNIFDQFIEVPNDKTEELIDTLNEILNYLDDEQQQVIKHMFGIITGRKENPIRTALVMKITAVDVDINFRKSLEILRKHRSSGKFKKILAEHKRIQEEHSAKILKEVEELYKQTDESDNS
ncbi:MAG: hypothetical protein K6C94_09275 [Candidatus Gastranaerophilales bacterium]|nr:hypothetical protein [Candidatus Gastranaerophilales bacterium]